MASAVKFGMAVAAVVVGLWVASVVPNPIAGLKK